MYVSTAANGNPRKNSRIIYAIIAVLSLLFFMPASFNPLGRFAEIPANNYRTLYRTIEAANSMPLQITIREILNRDGKLTQENSVNAWQAWEKSVPAGMEIGQPADTLDRNTERQKLINLVGAKPVQTVWTPLSK